jgi:hypothetical protein
MRLHDLPAFCGCLSIGAGSVLVLFVNFFIGISSLVLHAMLFRGSDTPTAKVYALLFSFHDSGMSVILGGNGAGALFGIAHGLAVITCTVVAFVGTLQQESCAVQVGKWAIVVEVLTFFFASGGKVLYLCDDPAVPVCTPNVVIHIQHVLIWVAVGLYGAWVLQTRASECEDDYWEEEEEYGYPYPVLPQPVPTYPGTFGTLYSPQVTPTQGLPASVPYGYH